MASWRVPREPDPWNLDAASIGTDRRCREVENRKRMAQQSIPVLDMDRQAAGGEPEAAFAVAVGEALSEIGFFAVVNHGVDRELIRRAYAAAEQFFALPEPVKRNYELPRLKGQRGFTSFGKEHAKDQPAPDLKEFWHVGREVSPDHPRVAEYPANVWPSEVPAFEPVFRELYSQLDRCSMRLLEAVGGSLGVERSRISAAAREGNSILRIIHYPPVPEGVDPASLRAAPHEDINLITLLCESTDRGLELRRRDGTWLPIEAIPGQIIVDAGDMLQNLTNGVLRSTTHRVVNPDSSRARRFSMPFFVHPRSEVSLAPLAACVEQVGEKRYPDITAGEYLLQRLREIGLA